MKKFLILLMLLCSVTASAQEFPVGRLWYRVNADSITVRVINPARLGGEYDGLSGDLVIPETVTESGKTYSVSIIDSGAFVGCTGLTSVTIPNSVIHIGSAAFNGCSGLTSVTIGDSVTTIETYAFKGCSGLTGVTIPNSVTSIAEGTFYYCSGLTSVTIPTSVTSIGKSAFNGCSGLTSVSIPNSVTKIGDFAFQACSCLTSVTIGDSVTTIGTYAFEGCSGLTGVTIPNSVTSIGYLAFAGCSGLESIVVASGNSKFDSRDNCNAIIRTAINRLDAGCNTTVIPQSVTSIGGFAFQNCSGLTEVTIPNSVMSIGTKAFSGCSGLADIYSEISNPTTRTTESNAFEGVPYTTCTLHVPAETKHMYQVTTPWNNFENIIEGEGKDPCDINGDGVVDIFDVNMVINAMLGIE